MKLGTSIVSEMTAIQACFFLAMKELADLDRDVARQFLRAKASDVDTFANVPTSELATAINSFTLPVLFVYHPNCRPNMKSPMKFLIEEVKKFDVLGVRSGQQRYTLNLSLKDDSCDTELDPKVAEVLTYLTTVQQSYFSHLYELANVAPELLSAVLKIDLDDVLQFAGLNMIDLQIYVSHITKNTALLCIQSQPLRSHHALSPLGRLNLMLNRETQVVSKKVKVEERWQYTGMLMAV